MSSYHSKEIKVWISWEELGSLVLDFEEVSFWIFREDCDVLDLDFGGMMVLVGFWS